MRCKIKRKQRKEFSFIGLTNSLIADSGIDLENPRPLHVFVGVLTSFTTTFFCMANNKEVVLIYLAFSLIVAGVRP